MSKLILFSGAQPSGRLHLGNYLGALKNWVDLQNSERYQCYFAIVDAHSITENFDPKEKSKQILELAADYLAVGLDPRKSFVFLQSQVPAHAELAWIFNALAPLGEMERMTQFKDKAAHQRQNVNIGLLTYPLLMAADILLYDAKFVPVGEDQIQHLELTRALARKFNKRFGHTFTEPQALLTKTARVMSLKDPSKKMSKSQPETCLFLDDTPEEIKRKMMSAVTDSGSEVKYDPEKKPGVSNLLDIHSGVSGRSIPELEKEFAGKTYSEFKASVAEAVAAHLADYRKRKKELRRRNVYLKNVLTAGSKRAALVANKKVADVKKKIGLAI